MNLTSNLYGIRRSGVSHGDVFTSPRVVSFMLDLIGYTSDRDLSLYNILEPSFGNGEFLKEIQQRISLSSEKYGFDASEVMSHNVYGCEIDKTKFVNCIDGLKKIMPDLDPVNFKNEDFLFSIWDVRFDFIIGNPPYVRYENIPIEARSEYKNRFKTFHYRSDLYVLFFEHCLYHLSVNGRHCFICSNRWIKNEYGKKLRKLISTAYSLDYLIDVEQLNAFKESVSAYPAITVISNTHGNHVTNVTTIDNTDNLNNPIVFTPKRIKDPDNWNNLFLEYEPEHLFSIEQQGFVIGIGVATGADNLFISPNLKGFIEEALLIPIVNARDLTGNKFAWKGAYLLNPYDQYGNLVDLNKYPNAKNYLESHKKTLEQRHIVKKGREWYSLIDKVKNHVKSQPKILLPDISGNSYIFVDDGNFYPAHNIYYVTGKNKTELDVLAAVLMSDFVKAQIASVSNKMNGGIPRWQSQSIKKLRIPLISKISSYDRHRLLNAYHKCSMQEINECVNRIVSSQVEEYKTIKSISAIPLSLFDYE